VTMIEYTLPKTSTVSLKVYDILGREVASIVDNQNQTPGIYKYFFNANELSSGVYLYRITADGFVSSKKMMVIK
ncbi:MAG: T9SS type A sorting domain-containing protein, partial [Ignavibacteria bacterium]|nr:T9SS type A sorting domain-containing protein [Ignavibacteria bacterium]